MAKIEEIAGRSFLDEKIAVIKPSTWQTAREIYEGKDRFCNPKQKNYFTSDLAVYCLDDGRPIVYFLGREGNPLADEKLREEFYLQLKKGGKCIPDGKPLEHILNALQDKEALSLYFSKLYRREGYTLSELEIYSVFGRIDKDILGIPILRYSYSKRKDVSGNEEKLIRQIFGIGWRRRVLPCSIKMFSPYYVRTTLQEEKPGSIIAAVGSIFLNKLDFYSNLENERECIVCGERKKPTEGDSHGKD